MNRYLMSL